MQLNDTKPWWKYRWPWILMSGPAVAVIGCTITIWVAFNVNPDTPLHEGVLKQGLKVIDQKVAH